MLTNLNERLMHRVRLVLTFGWILIIFSLFYDPITPWLTDPNNTLSPIRLEPELCVMVQENCLEEIPYGIGARFFWAAIVPAGIFIIFVLGHEFWRRICPLSFLSQIPRALGWQRQIKKVDPKTGIVRYEVAKVAKNSWLSRNALYLQFGLFFIGLCLRILFVNSNRIALGLFLIGVILAAILVGYCYGGKSWCHYFCPMGAVQKVYGEPRGLINSTAHEENTKKITQSMCRTVNQEGKEISACVACNTPCLDIDAERSYWNSITQPQERFIRYCYFGIVIGFYCYYYFYAGNWDYYFTGAWTHEENQLATLFDPGFYFFGQQINIPKLVAVPLTLSVFALISYRLGTYAEKLLTVFWRRRNKNISKELIRHRMFTLSTFLIFNIFFIFGGKPSIRLLPIWMQSLFSILIAVTSSLWLHRTWRRSPELYSRESLANRLRKQLKKLNLDTSRFVKKPLDDLEANEVYVLAKVLPGFDREKRLQTYKSLLRDALDEGYVNAAESLVKFQPMRTELNLADGDHETVIFELSQEQPNLFAPTHKRSYENIYRLASYREKLLETILESWKARPEQVILPDLLKVFQGNSSKEALEELLQSLSPDNFKIVQTIRKEYGITAIDEKDALSRTDPDYLWKAIAAQINLLDNLDSEEKILELFHQFDADNSGYISLEELKLYVRNLDSNFTDSQIKAMLTVADTSGDKQISYEEFYKVLGSVGTIVQK